MQQSINLKLMILPILIGLSSTFGPCCATLYGQSISHIVPSAIDPEKTTKLTIYGSGLSGATQLWTSFEADVQLAKNIKGKFQDNGKSDEKITYLITPKKKLEVGVSALRIATRKGVSNFKLLMVDDLESQTDNGKNHSLKTAQNIATAVAIDGQADSLKADFYQIKVKAAQKLTIDVLGGRIGSAMDPVIKLLDSGGQELAYSDDAQGVGNDARLKYQFKKEGTYYIKVRDMQYRGGVTYRYRMRVGYFPLTTGSYPLACRSGSTTRVIALGESLDTLASKKITIPEHRFGGVIPIGMKYPAGKGSGFLSLKITQQTEVLEFEPNDKTKTANRIPLPTAINGRFNKPGDRDYFQFIARKGQRLIFTGKTRSHRSPSQLFMQLFDSKGKLLATEEDTGKTEGQLDFKVAADGTYHLKVEELLYRGGGAHAYRIEVQPYRPQFSLHVATTRIAAPQSGSFALKVTATRKDYQGQIKLLVAGAGGGFTSYQDVIPAGKNETTMIVSLAEKFKVGQLHHINIIGTANTANHNLIETASTRAAIKKQMPNTINPPELLEGAIGLVVIDKENPLMQVALDRKTISHPKLLNQSSFKLNVTRLQKSFQSPLQILVNDLPPTLKATVKPVGKGVKQYLITLSGTVQNKHMLKLVAIATEKAQTQVVELKQIPIQSVPPVMAKLLMSDSLKRGKSLKIKAKIDRVGEWSAPITLRLKNLPKGVTTKEKYNIKAKQTEIEIELKASTDAQLGEVKNVLVTATASINKKDFTTQSPPAILKVIK